MTRYGRMVEDVTPVPTRGGVYGALSSKTAARRPFAEHVGESTLQILDDQWRFDFELIDHTKTWRTANGHGRPALAANRA